MLQRTHLLHHSHTNTDKDPDISVKGTFVALVGKWAKGVPTSLVPISMAKYLSKDGYSVIEGLFSKAEILQSSLLTYATLGLLAVAVATGHAIDWLCLLFIPQQLAILILMIFLQWLPHYPFDRVDRYRATRVSLWFGADLLTLCQNLHLMHHLWPSVPFYNYRRLYVALKAVLAAEGSPIQGLGVGPWSRSKA